MPKLSRPARPFLGPAKPDYASVHYHLRLAFGSAKLYFCAERCGREAKKWSYDNRDPHEMEVPHGSTVMKFSANLSHYRPLCNQCHHAEDWTRRVQDGTLHRRYWGLPVDRSKG